MTMQMDAEFKKEQSGTLFCLGAGRGVHQANEAEITPNLQDCASMRQSVEF